MQAKEPESVTNALGQPVGLPVDDTIATAPASVVMQGSTCRLEPLNAATHAASLYDAYAEDTEHRIWTYLPYGPFHSECDYRRWIQSHENSTDPLFFAIINQATDRAIGIASYLRIDTAARSIEVGHINYSPALQKTVMATEAMYLMMRHVFNQCGYRRYEWKCDALNAGSRRAAQRLGFVFEGVFRQATVYKGRNRDTAWYSITDREWPALEVAFKAWLDSARQLGTPAKSLAAYRE